MQLRVARLCLDCEELHVADACPICASERYAFLSTWLPSDERRSRRWRRQAAASASDTRPSALGQLSSMKQTVLRFLGGGAPDNGRGTLKTRASDSVPKQEFKELGKEPSPKEPARAPKAIEGDLR